MGDVEYTLIVEHDFIDGELFLKFTQEFYMK